MIMAVIGELAGGVDIQDRIVDCLPESWRPNVKENDKNKADESVATSAGQSSSVLKKVLDVVSKVIKFVCKFKSKVVKLLTGKMRRYYRRQQMKMNFMENRSHGKGFKYYRKWFGSRAVKKIKGLAKKAGSAIKKGFNKAKEVVKKVANKIKDAALWIVKELKDIFTTFVAKIKQIVNNPIIQRIVKILQCGKEFFGHVKTIISIIKGIVNRVQKVVRSIASQTYVDLVVVIVDLICNFDHFRAAVGYLVDAVREKNTLKKFTLFGKFFGKLLYALGYGGDTKDDKKGKKGGNKPAKRSSGSSRRTSRRSSRRGRRNYY